VVPLWLALGAILFAVLIGLIAGWYPAARGEAGSGGGAAA
jgi:ABC-type antimicrobial peptide transport system permease subunit